LSTTLAAEVAPAGAYTETHKIEGESLELGVLRND
jgi:hypothetical protein